MKIKKIDSNLQIHSPDLYSSCLNSNDLGSTFHPLNIVQNFKHESNIMRSHIAIHLILLKLQPHNSRRVAILAQVFATGSGLLDSLIGSGNSIHGVKLTLKEHLAQRGARDGIAMVVADGEGIGLDTVDLVGRGG